MKQSLYLLLLFPSLLFAGLYQCPGGTNSVNLGDTPEEVQKQCGAPQAQNKVLQQETTKEVLQYQISGQLTGYASNSFSITLENDKVTQLSGGGNSKMMSLNCPNGNVALKADINTVRTACGTPFVDNKYPVQKPNAADQKENWIYQPQDRSYLPKTQFTFQSGRLVSVTTLSN